jgi:hypothetical protein
MSLPTFIFKVSKFSDSPDVAIKVYYRTGLLTSYSGYFALPSREATYFLNIIGTAGRWLGGLMMKKRILSHNFIEITFDGEDVRQKIADSYLHQFGVRQHVGCTTNLFILW